MPASRQLAGKVGIVTGASSGIGRSIAEHMAQAGAEVALVGRDVARLSDCAGSISRNGGAAEAIAVDVTKEEAPARIVNSVVHRFGSIDVIVHSAGIYETFPFAETPLASLDRQWAVNVRAPFALTQAALPYLRPGSTVIFVSSITGHVAFKQAAAYCVTKGGIELLTRALALELAAQGIRVNALAPGIIRTPMNAHQLASPEYEAGLIERIPCHRIGSPDDVGPVAVFLASDAAAYIHGASVLVDGGWVID